MSSLIGKLALQNQASLQELQEKLGYTFQDVRHLQRALVHSSFAFEQGAPGNDNETLEFLGDAVLDLTIGYTLFTLFPELKEGELTKLRSALVNERSLASMARTLGLGAYLHLGKGEDASQGRKKPSILASGLEAVVGAIFVDGAYDRAMEFVKNHFTSLIRDRKEMMLASDAKSLLQEKLQAEHGEAPEYVTDIVDGPAHNREFTVSVIFRGRILGTGKAKSKKKAEQRAAAQALEKLKTD